MDYNQISKLVYVSAAVSFISIAVLVCAFIVAVNNVSPLDAETPVGVCVNTTVPTTNTYTTQTTNISGRVYNDTSAAQIVVSGTDPFDCLGYFIANDTTDQRAYIRGEYVCIDFAIDFAQNATNAGYDVGIVMCAHKGHRGHALCWVAMPEPYNMLYVEPILDDMYNPDVYTNRSGDWSFREISIAQAIVCNNDMRRWGIK